ncbi:XrtA/PEP-CTERM system TPR-repeat protein PrsT [Alteromonas gilva]|uniref:PEP-CTERM system TPR-repeat protein PrsT n=1 Tax=Alteromonas gilva TaxID=2987522 RepID=A0ABT5L6X2_9ALTE|nr:XrtA/PEP-CTERM system TPR-repeat protein PrsT [Alteromonas gilva]MDC8832795.1 PEP-CTERM system TPR-repeat protein PrsT [Alteromonas gilva]
MRLTLALLVLLCLPVCTLSFASSEDDYEKALSAYNQAAYDDAFIHLKNSLKQDPDNLAAKILMGKILLINGYLNAAESEFYEALDQGADFNLVAEALGNALLFQNKYERVINFNGTEQLVNEHKLKWLQIRATACTRLGRLECANSAYRQSLDIDPTYIPAYNGLASVALSQEDFDAVQSYLDKALSFNGESPVTWRLKGELSHARNDYDNAIDYLQKALRLDPNDPVTLRKLADIYLKSNDFDSARAFVDEIIQKTPNDPLAILLSSWLESKDKKQLISNSRLEQLNEIMASLSPEIIADQPVLLYISGLTAFFHGNTEQAGRDFSRYLISNPNDTQAIVLLARTYLMTQRNRQALILLEKHEKNLLDDIESALLLGDLYLKQNKTFKAQRLSDELSERFPEDPRVSLYKIRLMALRGNMEQAIAILDSSYADNNQNVPFLLTYSLLKLREGSLDDALKSAEAILALYPDDPDFINLKAGILIRLKEYDEALDLIMFALAKKPDLFAAKFNKAAILSRQQEFEASNIVIEELLELSPNHPQSLLLKAHNMVKQGNVENAISLYNDILVLDAGFTYARLELAKLHQSESDFDRAIYHVDRLLVDDFDNADYLLLKTTLLIQKRNNVEARKTLAIVEHFTKESVSLLLQQSELQRAVNDLPGALKSLDTALELAPNSQRLALEKIKLLIETNELTTAKQLLDNMRNNNGENANYWLVMALYHKRQDDTQGATASLQQALNIDPDFYQALVLLYDFALRGNNDEAFTSQSEKILKSSPQNVLAKNLLAQFYFIQGNFDKATALYKSLLLEEKLFNKPIVLNKLAVMSLEQDLQQAKEYITQAYELDSSAPEILDTYGWVLVQQGQLEDGLGILRRAFARDSKNPETRYHIGYTLAKLNRNNEAIDELQKAVSVERPFYSRNKAQSLLDSLL